MKQLLVAASVLLLPATTQAQGLAPHSCNDRGICCEKWKIPLLWNDGKTENVGTGTWGAIVDVDLAAAQAKLAREQERERESCARTGKTYPCWETGYGNPQPPRCVEPPPESDPCSAEIQAKVSGLLEKTRQRTNDLIVGNSDAPFADDIAKGELTDRAVEKAGLKTPAGYRAGEVTQGYANALGDAARKLGDLKSALDRECAPVPNPIVDLYGSVFNGFEDRHTRRGKLTRRIEDVCGPAEEAINATQDVTTRRPSASPTKNPKGKSGKPTATARPEGTTLPTVATPVAQPTKSRCPSMNWSEAPSNTNQYCSKCEDFCNPLTFAREVDRCMDSAGADYAGRQRAFESCCERAGGELASKGGPCD